MSRPTASQPNRSLLARAAVGVALCGAGALHAGSPQVGAGTTPPFVIENSTVKIAPHTYVIPDRNVAGVPNIGIVVGERAALVIDTGLGVRNGDTVLREVQKFHRGPELFVAATHFHPEHDLGASAFPPHARMLRSLDQLRDIDEFGLTTANAFSERSPVMAELLRGAVFRNPDIVFEREHLVDLGGVRVRAMAVGPAHTRGDTAFFVEGDRVLFAGDVAMPNLPVFASPYSSFQSWLASLDHLGALEPGQVVPSHGPIGDARMIAGYREFLELVLRRAGELKAAGHGSDATTETISEELRGRYASQQPGRIAPAVRLAYGEIP
jgi:glyoxylase-like metal-dependent hydrolase (beta-lactamase superfamily II)